VISKLAKLKKKKKNPQLINHLKYGNETYAKQYADMDCLNQYVVYTLCGLRSGLGNECEAEVEVMVSNRN